MMASSKELNALSKQLQQQRHELLILAKETGMNHYGVELWNAAEKLNDICVKINIVSAQAEDEENRRYGLIHD